MPLQDITITASINSLHTMSYGQTTYIASTDEQSFPIETFSGGYAGTWPNFKLKGLNSTDSASNTTNNLIVNITQSWSGSNITPLGIVSFFHNTMEEFVNGEFSGSSIEVSDGSLLDPYCEQFLIPSIVPINYSVFPFFKNNIGINLFPSLLNLNTQPNSGEIYLGIFNFDVTSCLIQYAKIAKIDALGHDNTLTLRELQKFKYTDSNAGTIICDIINIAEYPNYFFYELVSNQTTNIPFDDNYLNFALSASYTASSIPSQIQLLSSSYGTWTIINNPNNNFNSFSGSYIFANTPNTIINYTSSITFEISAFASINFGVYRYGYTPSPYINTLNDTGVINYSSPGPYTITISGSTTSIIETNYIAPIIQSTVGLQNVTASFIVTQSAAPQSSTSSFNLEPYLISNFNNTDCDVLMNNAPTNRFSKTYRRVLYDNGSVIPSNLEQILTGSAEFVELQDYNYNSHASVRSRYDGVRTTSPNFNLLSTTGFSNRTLSVIDSNDSGFSFNQLPNVRNLQTYFAYFDFVQNTSFELINKAACHIVYLIDKDGTISIPSISGSYYPNLIDNFETNKYAEIIIETENGDKEFLGLKKIIQPGVLPRGILYSQNMDTPIPVNTSITFQDSDNIIPLVQFKAGAWNSTFSLEGQSGGLLYLDPILLNENTSKEGTSKSIKIDLTTNLTKISFNGGFYYDCVKTAINFTSNTQYTPFYVEKSSDGGTTWQQIYNTVFGFEKGTTGWKYFNTPYFNCVQNDLYRFYFGTGQYSFFKVDIFSPSYIQLNQSPTPQDASASYSPSANQSDWTQVYFVTGSSSPNILTSSQLFPYYNPADPYIQSSSLDSGYGPLLPFVFNKGDQVRFEADESQVYTIEEAFTDNLNLLPTNFSSSFFIYNYGPNPTFTLNANGGFDSNNLVWGQVATINPVITFPTFISNYKLKIQISNGVAGEKLGVVLGDENNTGMQTINVLNGTNVYTVTCVPNDPDGRVRLVYGIDTGYGPGGSFSGTIDYLIYESGNALFVKLYGNILPGTNINSFLFRRLQPNPNFVIVDSIPLTGSGYLFAQYSTDELKQNFDNIIVDLKERILI